VSLAPAATYWGPRARGTSPHPPGPQGAGYANPPKQQGGPRRAKGRREAKRNREKTSRRPSGQVMGESRDQDPGAASGDAPAQASAGGCNCVRQAVASATRGNPETDDTQYRMGGIRALSAPGARRRVRNLHESFLTAELRLSLAPLGGRPHADL
jgi:hypothetical protein